MIIRDCNIFLPSGELPDTIKIGDRRYNTIDLLKLIEEITGTHIICKYKPEAIRRYKNTTIRIPIELNTNSWDALKIYGKDNTYLLTPSF